MALCRWKLTIERARTGAGNRAFRMDPSGASVVKGRKTPSLLGVSGSRIDVSPTIEWAWVTFQTQLMELPSRCRLDPLQSSLIAPPFTVMVTARCTGSRCPSQSALPRETPSGSRLIAPAIATSDRARISSAARSMAPVPKSALNSMQRAATSLPAPIIAPISPMTRRGWRVLASITS